MNAPMRESHAMPVAAPRVTVMIVLLLWAAPGAVALELGVHTWNDRHVHAEPSSQEHAPHAVGDEESTALEHKHASHHPEWLDGIATAVLHGHRHDGDVPAHEHSASSPRFCGSKIATSTLTWNTTLLGRQEVSASTGTCSRAAESKQEEARSSPPPPHRTANCSLLL